MEKIVDLSGPIESGLWGYHELPGLENIVPRVEVSTIASVQKDGFFASKLIVSTISGTYLEAGSHVLDNGKTLDQYPVDRFFLVAKVLRLPEQRDKSRIGPELLKEHAPPLLPGEALLIDTGWGKRWNTPGYVLSCPTLYPDAIQWILEKEISLLGVDIPCIEASWSEDEQEEKGSMLGELFARDTLLLAPLVGLEKVSGTTGKLVCLPLNLRGTSGAPCRAIFIEHR